jgi:hypothetical protein
MEEIMKQSQHEKILQNRAAAKNASICPCDNCGENMIFALQDNYHQFSMGIEDILMCLRIAEDNGAVPKLQNDWWADIMARYNGLRF